MSGYFTFKMAAVFYRKGISIVFMYWMVKWSIEVYYSIIHTPLSVEIIELCLKVWKMKKAYKIRLFETLRNERKRRETVNFSLSFSAKTKNHPFGWFCFGGEGGIRTLDGVLAHTRVPVIYSKLETPRKYGLFQV